MVKVLIQWLKLWMYSFNILIIQILGKVNEKLYPFQERWTVNACLCYAPYEYDKDFGAVVYMVCCDCGAGHIVWEANNGIYAIPCIPAGYEHRLRLPVESVTASPDDALLVNYMRTGR